MSLADVLPNCLAALRGEDNSLGLPRVTHAVVLLSDGLGAHNLRARRGHARTLASRLDRDAPLDAGFPTTTAAVLASLTTGVRAGAHGMVGYTVHDPENDRVVNELSGWEDAGLDPLTWQRVPTIFERAAVDDRPIHSVIIGPERYRSSGLTRAILRGGEYRSANSLSARIDVAARALREPGPRLIYIYAPETDMAAHKSGWMGSAYTAAIEELDAAVADLVRALRREQGLLVTADHGIVDVPTDAHRIVPPELLREVRHLAGEPRGLQLHLEPGADPAAVAAEWRAWAGVDAWIVTRAEAIAADYFGPVDPAVEPRIGDLLVIARAEAAFYDDANAPSRGMVGQHGALTEEERTVPLLRFGAFESAR